MRGGHAKVRWKLAKNWQKQSPFCFQSEREREKNTEKDFLFCKRQIAPSVFRLRTALRFSIPKKGKGLAFTPTEIPSGEVRFKI